MCTYTYYVDEQQRSWQACASAQSHQGLICSHPWQSFRQKAEDIIALTDWSLESDKLGNTTARPDHMTLAELTDIVYDVKSPIGSLNHLLLQSLS